MCIVTVVHNSMGNNIIQYKALLKKTCISKTYKLNGSMNLTAEVESLKTSRLSIIKTLTSTIAFALALAFSNVIDARF